MLKAKLTHWKRPEKAGEERDDRRGGIVGWHHQLNGYEFEQTLKWSRTVKPGVLQVIKLQRVGHD